MISYGHRYAHVWKVWALPADHGLGMLPGAISGLIPYGKPLHVHINVETALRVCNYMYVALSMHQCMPHQCLQGSNQLQHHTGRFWQEPEIRCFLQQRRPSLQIAWPAIPSRHCHPCLLALVLLPQLQPQCQLHTCH